MKQPISVLIPDGESKFALFAAHSLAQFQGTKIHVLSTERWSSIRFSRYCYSFTFRQAESDDQTQLDVVADIVKAKKIDVILPTETNWISFAIANREALSKFAAIAPLPEPSAFQLANNKWLLSQFLTENQIPEPPTVLVTCDDVLDENLKIMQFPVLLKPITAWGGDGIERFETLSDLKRCLEQQNLEKIKNRFIVQSLLPGTVVGVNVLSQNGKILATTLQRGIIPNTQKYAAAGGIKFIKENKFLEIAQQLISALNWSGFANIDTLLDSQDNQLKILEINARFWGSLRGSLAAGVNFPYLACLAGLGIPFPVPDYKLAHYIHSKTALKAWGSRFFKKNSENGFALQETGLKFLLVDPLAETIRAFQQEVLADEPTTVLLDKIS